MLLLPPQKKLLLLKLLLRLLLPPKEKRQHRLLKAKLPPMLLLLPPPQKRLLPLLKAKHLLQTLKLLKLHQKSLKRPRRHLLFPKSPPALPWICSSRTRTTLQ